MGMNRRILFGAAAAGGIAPLAASAVAQAAPEHHRPSGPGRVRTGAELQAAKNWRDLRGRKLGVIANPTAVLPDLTSVVDAMAAAKLDIRGVFGPEHGFRGTAQAGEAEGTTKDPRTGLTVYDAYGAGVDKMSGMFNEAGIDTVVFDIQDAGARFYTYIWTMYTAMKAAVKTNKSFIVLDRPNPDGGTARGPLMTEEFTSGVGAEAIVQQHGMTAGELAKLFNGQFLKADTGGTLRELKVIQCQGWRGSMLFEDTGLQFVPPSPNMPTPDTALLYPGTGMFEGTNLSEGRGTTRPFEIIGAPFVDHKWSEALNRRRIPGVLFRETYFTPTFSKHKDKVCGGVQVHITDAHCVDPIRVAVEMLVQAKKLYPDFAWRKDDWDKVRPYWVDKLSGSIRLRTMIDSGASADQVINAWRGELAQFNRMRQQYLLYSRR